MAADDPDQALREAAAHRGLKLVKSRRRKPGSGDYGKYGLSDSTGAPSFGFGKDGLTASADEIAAYLRHASASTWQLSAESTPSPLEPRSPATSKSTPASATTRKQGDAAGSNTSVRKPDKRDAADETPPRRTKAASDDAAPPRRQARAPDRRRAPKRPDPPPVEPPEVAIRPARGGDAAAVAALVRSAGATPGEAEVAAFIAARAREKTPLLVAERGAILACLDWTTLRTMQRGTIGRIIFLCVAERRRREGIGRALVTTAHAAMRAAGCTAIEAISDIEIRNAHGFFRATGFVQTSYRLLLPLDAPDETDHG